MTDISRRSLLGFIAMAPFIVKASSLMPIFVPMPSRTEVMHFRIFDMYGKLVGESTYANGHYEEIFYETATHLLYEQRHRQGSPIN